MTTPLANLEALAAAVSTGPWWQASRCLYGGPPLNSDLLGVDYDGEPVVRRQEDADLIVAMRNSLDAILRALKAAEKVRDTERAIDELEPPVDWIEPLCALAKAHSDARAELYEALAALSSEPGAGR